MEKMFGFPSMIWIDQLDVDVESIKSFCLKCEAEQPTVKKSNIGGWQSKDDLIFHDELSELRKQITKKIQLVANELKLKLVLKMVGGWININRKGNSNLKHFHPGSYLSCCFYITSPDDSSLVFNDPRTVKSFTESEDIYHTINQYNHNGIRISSAVGKLVIFPSWLEHSVEPCSSDEPRISIACNYGSN